jgi:hypothetical protein
MRVSGDGYKDLNDAIQGASFSYRPMSTKSELIDYYKETYKGRGQEGWKQHIVKDLAEQTGMKRKNLERRFDPSRIEKKAGKAQQEQYKALGQTLPMKKEPKDTTGKRARVTWTGDLQTYDEKWPRVGKTYTGTLSASEARQMKKGSFDPVFASFGFPPGIITEIDVYSISVDFL